METSLKLREGETFVLLLRHGIAEKKGIKPDAERELTPEGHERMERIGRTIARIFPDAVALYTSPLVRCRQTADWVVQAFGDSLEAVTTDALLPEARAGDFRRLISANPARYFICVGHEPNLSTIASAVTGLGDGLELKKGGVYGIRFTPENATLEWLLPPSLLARAL